MFIIRILMVLYFLSFLNSISKASDAIVLKNITHITASENMLTSNIYKEIQINHKNGQKYAEVSIRYSKMTQLKNLKAHIQDKNGKIIRKLKNQEFIDISSKQAFSFFEDNYERSFSAIHNEYPYTFVFSYTLEEKSFLFIDYWTPLENRSIPVNHAEINLEIPKTYPIKFKQQNLDEPQIVENSTHKSYKWVAKLSWEDILHFYTDEKLTPYFYNTMPLVMVVPEVFFYEKKGSHRDWVAFGNWEYSLLEGLDDLPTDEKEKINLLISNCDNDLDKIKTLYNYVQDETRYINVSIATGGMKPYPASYVAKNKYGDCKALSHYFKSILNYVGINSYYTSIHLNKNIKHIFDDFPAQQFNHAIIYIPRPIEEGGDLWVDCTSKQAFNYLGTQLQNRITFVIDKDKSKLIKTPSLEPEDVKESRRYNINYSKDSSSLMSHHILRGPSYELLHSLDNQLSETRKKQYISHHFGNNNFEITKYEIIQKNRNTPILDLHIKGKHDRIYKNYGGDIVIENIPFTIPYFEKPTKRQNPVIIEYPIYFVDTIIYQKPEGYILDALKEDVIIKTPYGEYQYKLQVLDNTIVAIKSLLIHTGFISKDDYPNFYGFLTQLTNIDARPQIYLKEKP